MKLTKFTYNLILGLMIALLCCGVVAAEGLNNLQMLGVDWSSADSYNPLVSFYSPFTTTDRVLNPPRAYSGVAGTFSRAYPGTTGTFNRASAQTMGVAR